MVFFELRWNYSPLKEKAVLLPDGLFVCFCREALLRSTPLQNIYPFGSLSAPDASRSARGRRRGISFLAKFVASLRTPIGHLSFLESFCS